jgi:hypothetical protein
VNNIRITITNYLVRLGGLLKILGFVVLLFGVGYFIYVNWYLVVINPPSLDPGATQRRQTQILTSQYESIQQSKKAWSELPPLESVPNVFDLNH